MKILITGASGSGTTTLGMALSKKYDLNFYDGDDYFWLPSTPPYKEKRNVEERLQMILADIQSQERCILSGSIMNWGKALEDCFDFIVFLYLDSDIRLARLKKREAKELGFVDADFLDWASNYDNPDFTGRNLVKHEKWLAERSCQVVRIEGDLSVERRTELVEASWSLNSR